MEELARKLELSEFQERNRLHRAMRNGAWIRSIPHRLNGTELSQEELQDKLYLRYGMMPQDTPKTCNGCYKKFLTEYTLSGPKGGLVLVRHEDAAKEWVSFGSRALTLSAIYCEPKINSRTVQGEKNGDGAWQEGETVEGGTYIFGEA